jgi:hypothetical protein
MRSSLRTLSVCKVIILAVTAGFAIGGCSNWQQAEDTGFDAEDSADTMNELVIPSDDGRDSTGEEIDSTDLFDDTIQLDTDDSADADDDVEARDTLDTTSNPDIPDTYDTADVDSDHGLPDCPGAPGCECTTGDDCENGLCVPTNDKSFCGQLCWLDSGCPEGWICEEINLGDKTLRACIYKFPTLCQPCREDSECLPQYGARDRRFVCVDTGANGKFCGTGCAAEPDCPEGYKCADAPTNAGHFLQCQPDNGECACTEKFIEGGYETDCFRTNDIGTCPGTRTCDMECSAKSAEAEICNLQDDDCDGATDGENTSDCQTFFYDFDNDEYGTDDSKCLCETTGEYRATVEGDCNDNDPEVKPGNFEICNDGKDDNCDGLTDVENSQECKNYFLDVDGDGYGLSEYKCLCAASGNYRATRACFDSGSCDCLDTDLEVNPGRIEICNSGKDDNCDALADGENSQGCTKFYRDADNDGYGTGEYKCLCAAVGQYKITSACVVGVSCDCNDFDPDMNPGLQEVCGNGKDDNCDGSQDTENATYCIDYFLDADDDGFGVTGMKRCLCYEEGLYRVLGGGDCNDNNAAMNPNNPEICNNSIDDDCDGYADNTSGQPNQKCNVCGDGLIDNGEVCDHGNSNPGLACASDCKSIPCSNEADASITQINGRNCYWRSTLVVGRSDAASRCESRLGYLVRMETSNERDWVFGNMIFPPGSGSKVWVGAQKCGGNWCWDNGQIVGSEWDWSPGEPSGNGDCAQSSGNGARYDDVGCNSANRDYVCERPTVGTSR